MLRKKLMTACSVAVLMAALYGCSSSSDDGANMQVQDLQDQIAALNAELGEGEELTPEALAAIIQTKADAEADVVRLMGELGTANGEVTRLMGELTTATGNADAIQGMLNTANGEVTRLMGELTTATGNADAIQGMLNTANGEVTRLMGELTTATGNADAIQGMLNTANGEVTSLTDALALANTRADNAEDQITILMARADITPEDVQALRDQITTLMARDDTTPEDVQALRDQITTLMARDDITPEDVQALRDQITTLMARDDITPEDVQALRDQITTLMARDDITPEDVQALRDQITTLMARDDITPEDVQALRDQITTLMARDDITPEDVQALRDQITTLMAREDITPVAVQALRDQITTLMARDDITPEDVQALRDQITTLMARDDITPEDVQALRDQITTLMAREDITPAAVQALGDVIDNFATAYNARTNAEGAAEAASDAVEAAMKASVKIMTRASGVAGDSKVAEANAQAVLANRDAVNTAATTARNAKQSAESALSGATDATLMAALEEAIKVAEENLKAAMMSAEGDTLKAAVELVTGTDPMAEGYPMTPAQHGKAVAMAIGGALMPVDDTNGARMRGTHADADADAPNAIMFPDAVNMNNHVGSTWADIVGAGNIMKMRIASSMTATEEVDAASIEGRPRSSITDVAELTAVQLADGAQHEGAYKGILGTVFCSGDDCAVATMGADGDLTKTLTGSWYFTPEKPMAWYLRNAADTMYEPETLYVQFGHWLNENITDEALTTTDINTYAMTVGNTLNLALNGGDDNDALMDTSATYTGQAAGMSLHKEFDGQGGIVPGSLQSAAFTADVELTATFGTAPTLGGTVSNFQGGATDRDWSVVLLNRGFFGANFVDGTGTTTASGQDGVWTAQGYGPENGRPTGVFGGFNAHFSDGHAAGAYATRK